MHFYTDFYNFYKYPFWLSCLVIALRLRALRRTRLCAVSKYLCILYTPTVYEISNRVWDFIRHFARLSNALTSPRTRSFSHTRFASSIQMTPFCPIIHAILFVFCRRPFARRCFRVRYLFISPSCCRWPRRYASFSYTLSTVSDTSSGRLLNELRCILPRVSYALLDELSDDSSGGLVCGITLSACRFCGWARWLHRREVMPIFGIGPIRTSWWISAWPQYERVSGT